MQAVDGSNIMFLNLTTIFPGSLHDSRVLLDGNIFQWLKMVMFWQARGIMENTRITQFIIGNGGYILKKCLLTPYKFPHTLSHLSKHSEYWKQDRDACFNSLDFRVENVSKVIIVVLYSYNCALHIICQLSKDDYMDDDGIFEAGIRQEWNPRMRRRNYNRAPATAINTREATKFYFMNKYWHSSSLQTHNIMKFQHWNVCTTISILVRQFVMTLI